MAFARQITADNFDKLKSFSYVHSGQEVYRRKFLATFISLQLSAYGVETPIEFRKKRI
jgi:hypothetical protein